MANVFFWSTLWEGTPLPPGSAHNWWMVHSSWDDRSLTTLDTQVNITAHPLGWWKIASAPLTLRVENVRSHITAEWKRVMYFTVRNIGPNPVVAYRVGFSFIDE